MNIRAGQHVDLKHHYEMMRIRRIGERIAERYPEQKMRCPVHLSIGQEAVAVGVCQAAASNDFIVSNHRAHAHYLAKGGNLKTLIAEIYGKMTGCSFGRGGSMHLFDPSVGMMGSTPIIGGTMPIGVGIAFSSSLKNEERAIIICFGDAAPEEGIFSECLNFAALRKLPVLFVCENNFYSVYSSLSVRQPKGKDNLSIARAYGIWAEREFGNDVKKVHPLARHAFERIRAKQGPCFLEFTTYRHREHVGPNFDNNLNYRSEEEYQEWLASCPIKISENQLQMNKLFDNSILNKFEIEISCEIDEAFQFAETSPNPDVNLEEPVYSP